MDLTAVFIVLKPAKHLLAEDVAYVAMKYVDREGIIRLFFVRVMYKTNTYHLWFPIEPGALPLLASPPSLEPPPDPELITECAKDIRHLLDTQPIQVCPIRPTPYTFHVPLKKALHYDPLREAISISAGQYYIPYEVWTRWT